MGQTGIDRSVEWGSPNRPRRSGPRKAYPLKWVLVGLAVVALVVIGGPYVFFNVIEGKAPAQLSLPAADGAAAIGPVAAGPVSGTWTVSTGTQAGYRVDEILFGQKHTAVGRTSKVTGGMVISGTEVTAADFTVHLSSIRSDQRSRDAQFDGFIMKTYDYPDAKFHLTQPIQLGSIPAVGRQIHVDATGDLSMRGVTRQVSFPLSAERLANGIDVDVEIPIHFSEFHIPNPSFAVAKVGNTGTVEALLHLVRAPSAQAG